MADKVSKKGVSQALPQTSCLSGFAPGDLVERANGQRGKVLRRVTPHPGDSCADAYIVEGMASTVPGCALRRVETVE